MYSPCFTGQAKNFSAAAAKVGKEHPYLSFNYLTAREIEDVRGLPLDFNTWIEVIDPANPMQEVSQALDGFAKFVLQDPKDKTTNMSLKTLSSRVCGTIYTNELFSNDALCEITHLLLETEDLSRIHTMINERKKSIDKINRIIGPIITRLLDDAQKTYGCLPHRAELRFCSGKQRWTKNTALSYWHRDPLSPGAKRIILPLIGAPTEFFYPKNQQEREAVKQVFAEFGQNMGISFYEQQPCNDVIERLLNLRNNMHSSPQPQVGQATCFEPSHQGAIHRVPPFDDKAGDLYQKRTGQQPPRVVVILTYIDDPLSKQDNTYRVVAGLILGIALFLLSAYDLPR